MPGTEQVLGINLLFQFLVFQRAVESLTVENRFFVTINVKHTRGLLWPRRDTGKFVSLLSVLLYWIVTRAALPKLFCPMAHLHGLFPPMTHWLNVERGWGASSWTWSEVGVASGWMWSGRQRTQSRVWGGTAPLGATSPPRFHRTPGHVWQHTCVPWHTVWEMLHYTEKTPVSNAINPECSIRKNILLANKKSIRK